MTKEALKLALEALEYFRDTGTRPSDLAMSEDAITAIEEALAQPEQEPVALKRGECWPEDVMQMWDYYRKEIANGNTGSEPRDWFESLAEMRLIDTTPPQRKPLSFEQIHYAFRTNSVMVDNGNVYMVAGMRAINIARAIEAAHQIYEDKK